MREPAIVRAVAETAGRLGNTLAVCGASYIDPRVIERYRTGETIASTLARLDSPRPPGAEDPPAVGACGIRLLE